MAIDPDIFKACMGQLAAGVTIVTMHAGGQDHGFTATSFTSLSLDPALVLVCVVKQQRSHDLLQQAGNFAVNILATGQKELGGKFASSKTPDRFAGLDVARALTGAPILPGNVAWVDCTLKDTFDGGDHSIFVGEVVSGAASGEGEPLLYYNRAWGRFQAES